MQASLILIHGSFFVGVLCCILFSLLYLLTGVLFSPYSQSEVKSICGGHQLRAVLGKYSDSNWCNRAKPKIGKDGAAAAGG